MYAGFRERFLNLSILLVNYNGLPFLAACLDSIKRFAPPKTEVILADNGSTDESIEFLAREYPWVRVLSSSRNLGFAGGNNLAAGKAQGRLLLLLNTDTILLDPISPAVEWLESHPEYSVVTINMLDGGQQPQACTGCFPSPSRLVLLRRMLVEPQQYRCDSFHDVDWVQGSFLLIRAEHWKRLNGLDESYFMYVEDVDLCKRVHDLGFRCAYLPYLRYVHFGGFSTGRFPEQAASLSIYIRRHMRGFMRFVCWAILCFGCLSRSLLYGLRMLLENDESNRMRSAASWIAFRKLARELVGATAHGVGS